MSGNFCKTDSGWRTGQSPFKNTGNLRTGSGWRLLCMAEILTEAGYRI